MHHERLVEVPQANWTHEVVPAHLQHVCNVLNEALEIDDFAVSLLVGRDTPLFEPGAAERFERHPTIVLSTDGAGEPCLSAFGLLAGTVNVEHFRLAREVDNHERHSGPEMVLRFLIVRVTLEPDAA